MQINANIRPLAFPILPDLQQAREQDERGSTMIIINLVGGTKGGGGGGGGGVNANHIVTCSPSLAEND